MKVCLVLVLASLSLSAFANSSQRLRPLCFDNHYVCEDQAGILRQIRSSGFSLQTLKCEKPIRSRRADLHDRNSCPKHKWQLTPYVTLSSVFSHKNQSSFSPFCFKNQARRDTTVRVLQIARGLESKLKFFPRIGFPRQDRKCWNGFPLYGSLALRGERAQQPQRPTTTNQPSELPPAPETSQSQSEESTQESGQSELPPLFPIEDGVEENESSSSSSQPAEIPSAPTTGGRNSQSEEDEDGWESTEWEE